MQSIHIIKQSTFESLILYDAMHDSHMCLGLVTRPKLALLGAKDPGGKIFKHITSLDNDDMQISF